MAHRLLQSEFEPSGEPHHIFRVNFDSNITKPRQISPIDVFQWCVEQRIVHVHRRVRYVLPVRERHIIQCVCLFPNRSGKGLVERGV